MPQRCPEARRAEAVHLLAAAAHPQPRAALADAVDRAARPDWDGLLVDVDRDGSLRGAVWVQPLAGRYANVWPPRRDCADAGALLAEAARRCDQQGVCVGQVLANGTDDEPEAAVLERAGFPFVAPLVYLAGAGRAADDGGEAGPEWHRLDPSDLPRFERLFRDTERDSLDLPELQGARPADAVVDGFQAQGRHDPELWLVARVDGEDAAMLLMTPHPGTDCLELLYMGVRPHWRGRGLGRAAVDQALNCAFRRRCRIVLALDARNAPAHRMYESAGLAPVADVSLHARVVATDPRPPRPDRDQGCAR